MQFEVSGVRNSFHTFITFMTIVHIQTKGSDSTVSEDSFTKIYLHLLPSEEKQR